MHTVDTSSSEGPEPLAPLSPWDWYAGGDQLRNGLDAGGTLLLLASVLVLAGAAIPLFERRDLST